MNIVDAMYYQTLSPEKLSELICDSIIGFQDANIREINFYDIFLIIPFYTYSPVENIFSRISFRFNTSFQNKIERNPQLCANFEYRYKEMIPYIKKAILYMLDQGLIEMKDDLTIKLQNKTSVKNKVVYNVARVFSIKQTAFLFSFLRVDIDDI